jgi:hypothetical protein
MGTDMVIDDGAYCQEEIHIIAPDTSYQIQKIEKNFIQVDSEATQEMDNGSIGASFDIPQGTLSDELTALALVTPKTKKRNPFLSETSDLYVLNLYLFSPLSPLPSDLTFM